MRRFVILPVLMLLLGSLACASTETETATGGTTGGQSPATQAPELPDLSGTYAVNGTNQQGQNYQGTAEIKRSKLNNYTITWEIGSQQQAGSGVFDGTTFAVNWEMGSDKGTVTYTYQPDGSLKGTWTQDGVSGTGTETLTPQ